MKVTSPLHFVALLSLFVFLLTGQAGAQGFVWCLGYDGHAALEYAGGDKCGSPGQERDQGCYPAESYEFPSPEEHCGPCYDLPASFDLTARRSQDLKDSPLEASSPSAVQLASLPAPVRVLVTSLYPQPPPRISQTLLAHRTVVLLN